MDEKEDMFIDGPADLSEVYAKNSQYKPFLDGVLKGIKEGGTGGLKLRFLAPDPGQLKKKLNTLRSQCNYLGGEYAKIVFMINNNDGLPAKDAAGNNQFRVYAVLSDKAVKPAGGKNKRKTNSAGPAGGSQTVDGQVTKGNVRKKRNQPAVEPGKQPEGQKEWSDEAQKNLLQCINNGNMDAANMSNLMAQQQEGIVVFQTKLNDPATKEEDKAYINKQIQWAQEIIEAIKKRMGQ